MLRSRAWLAVLACVIGGAGAVARADEPQAVTSGAGGYISGTVTDAGTGQPLANVRVYVYPASGPVAAYSLLGDALHRGHGHAGQPRRLHAGVASLE